MIRHFEVAVDSFLRKFGNELLKSNFPGENIPLGKHDPLLTRIWAIFFEKRNLRSFEKWSKMIIQLHNPQLRLDNTKKNSRYESIIDFEKKKKNSVTSEQFLSSSFSLVASRQTDFVEASENRNGRTVQTYRWKTSWEEWRKKGGEATKRKDAKQLDEGAFNNRGVSRREVASGTENEGR